jgi:hypothetical protein
MMRSGAASEAGPQTGPISLAKLKLFLSNVETRPQISPAICPSLGLFKTANDWFRRVPAPLRVQPDGIS